MPAFPNDSVSWTVLALVLIGEDATVEEVNQWLQEIAPEFKIQSSDIATAVELFHRRVPARRWFKKAARRSQTAAQLLASPEGRAAIREELPSLSKEALLDLLGLA